MLPRHLLATALTFAIILGTARATVTIDPGVTEVFLGTTTSVQIPIAAVGGDAVTDLTAAISIAGGPTITAVSYTGSFWAAAPGGQLDFFPGFAPTGTTVDPNLSLLSLGETVAAAGTLLTLTIDITGLPVGDYAITLSATPAGDTKLFTTSGIEVATTLLPGVLRINDEPFLVWRATEFPDDFDDASAEATVWGNNADPDRDGLTNLQEFAWNLDPNTPDNVPTTLTTPGAPDVTTVQDGGETYLAITYTRRIESSSLNEQVETSTDLAIWDDTEAAITPFGPAIPHANGITEYVIKRHTTPLTTPSIQFLRVKITSSIP